MVKFILANQNQPDKTTDIVIDTNKTICPEFDLPKLKCDYSHVLSIDETETYLSFIVSPELSKEYEKLTQNLSRGQRIGKSSGNSGLQALKALNR